MRKRIRDIAEEAGWEVAGEAADGEEEAGQRGQQAAPRADREEGAFVEDLDQANRRAVGLVFVLRVAPTQDELLPVPGEGRVVERGRDLLAMIGSGPVVLAGRAHGTVEPRDAGQAQQQRAIHEGDGHQRKGDHQANGHLGRFVAGPQQGQEAYGFSGGLRVVHRGLRRDG